MPQTSNAFGNRVTDWTRAMENQLCDLVAADQWSFGQIAAQMGLSRDAVTSRWRVIVRRMGAQAI